MLERPLAGYAAPRAGFGLQARKRNIGVAGFADAVFRGVNAALRRKHVSQFRHVAVDWTIGHVHSGALGWVGLVSMGSIYYLIPRLFGRPEMYSLRLITLHFWLATVGIVLYIAAMWVAGVMQGLMWRAVGEDGTLTYTFVESVKASYPFYVIRLVGGVLYLAGMLIMAWNVWKTIAEGRPVEARIPLPAHSC